MLVKELKGIAYSTHGDICSCIVYDPKIGKDLDKGCSIEYAINTYGECELTRIEAYRYDLVLYIKEV